MKFQIFIKDPDGVGDCVQDAAEKSLTKVEGLSEEERSSLLEQRTEEIYESMEGWLEYRECFVIEVDTKARTATIQPVE